MEILQQLKNIYATLNRITVVGDNNIECMYGCFYTLTQMITEMEREMENTQDTAEK